MNILKLKRKMNPVCTNKLQLIELFINNSAKNLLQKSRNYTRSLTSNNILSCVHYPIRNNFNYNILVLSYSML